MDTASSISSLDAISMEAFCGNRSHVMGRASTAMPTVAGMAINMVVFTACAVFLRAPFISPLPASADTVGRIAEAMAVEIAMGILEMTTALPEKIP